MLVDGRSGADHITAAIRGASRATGANFDFLLDTAIRESALDPSARARSSSARGLFQFIESTWLSMVKEEGSRFGLGRFAEAIQRGPDGRYSVSDPLARTQILKLREDPKVASVMAGALARRNAAELQDVLGRKPTAGELYLAHFLGANGAKRLIRLQQSNPTASAAAAFPDAARANRAIFHGANGEPRSAAEVFAVLTGRHDGQGRPTPVESNAGFADLRPTLAPETSGRVRNGPAPREVYAHPVIPGHSAFAPEEGPAFQALFRNGAGSAAALSPAVREIWGAFDSGARGLNEIARSPSPQQQSRSVGEPLDILAHLKAR